MEKKSSILLLTVFSFLLSCAEQKNPFNLADISTGLGEVKYLVRTGTLAERSVFFPDPGVQTSDVLLLGKYRLDESAILLKFGTIADELDSLTVQKALLTLQPKYRIRGASSSPLQVSVHQVTYSWDEETIQPSEVLNHYNSVPVSTGELSDTTTARDSLLIDSGIVQKWIDKSIENDGVLLLAPNADHLTAYFSDETAFLPQLKIVYEKQGKLDSTSIQVSEALSVLQSHFQLPPDRLVVGSGVAYGSFFLLDYSEIPKNSTINQAYLQLHVDTSATVMPKGEDFEMIQMMVNSSDWVNFAEKADTSSSDTTLYRGGNSFKVDLTDVLQTWVNREKEDFGFRLTPYGLGRGLFRAVFYASTASDSLLRPKLEVYYSVPKDVAH